MPKRLNLFLIFFFLSVSIANAARDHQSHEEIIASVQKYLDTHLSVTQGVEIKTVISRIDRRLKLFPCTQPLKTFTNNNAGFNSKISVGVRCEGIKPWSLYVPVKIQRFAKVFVAAQPIGRGDQITLADIQQVSQDVSNLKGRYYKTVQDIVGKMAKRSIRLGSVFKPRNLTLPMIIKKGDMVDIVAEGKGLRIRMTGRAINAGAKGQQINVKNLSSKRIIQAIVEHPGLVKILM